MIDEKYLLTLESALSGLYIKCDKDDDQHLAQVTRDVYFAEQKDLIRLARLGLWAEQYGVPTMNQVRAAWLRNGAATESMKTSCNLVDMALAALPKDAT